MATVHLGNDLKHDRQVAIKVLHPEIAAAIGTERFLLEIKIAARLTHPHIVPLHDSGEIGGLLFYVMPFVEGESLRDRLTREKQLPIESAIRIAREVADALHYAHTHRVLHRDIKPENILLESGHAVVADFGVARAIGAADAQRVTATGIAVGTPAYMSPEQAAGTKDLDERSDVYGLACVLYEMLAGQPPYIGPTVESVIRQHFTADVPNVASIRASVPPEVVATLTRALAKTPADRFSSAREFADALEKRASIATPHPAERPASRAASHAQRSALRRPRRRTLVMLSLALLTLVAIGAAFTKTARVLWARARDIPSLQTLVASGDWEAAHRIAERLESILPEDSILAAMRSTFSDVVSIEGTPAGARVYRKAYNTADAWEQLGVAPIARTVVPRLPVVSQFKFEAPGFQTAFEIGAASAVAGATPLIRFALVPDGSIRDSMVLVMGGDFATGIPQLDPGDRARVGDFHLDRYEVTNREYQTFVDSGGYKRRDLWEHAFVQNGRRLTWDEALPRFIDQTGRPGPSTWEAGRYPADRANYPVAGVSWFEAAAYAKFRGKRLPNVFQWSRAARFESAGAILSASNIERQRGGSTAPVGSFGGMSGSGAFDMAGNVREWCYNESKTLGGRFILGGGWNDAAYRFFESAVHSPFDRSLT
ncbi:MAG: bifunctional serine/threonine-protein kinase/formylglycine-generating enzyme family protein, partial [Gemmatimonadaceae bacterium]